MEKKQVEKDLAEAVKLMTYGRNYKGAFCSSFGMYDCIYPFNNENIVQYYEKFNYEKGVLAVASSGDHMLHALLGGTNKITLFDINKLTYYFCRIKLAAVKALTYDEFFDFFGKEYGSVPSFYKKNIYEKIKKYLEPEDIYFWDGLYESGLGKSYDDKNLFNLISAPYHNAYYKKEKYEELQKKAQVFENPKFICTDVLDLPKYLDSQEEYSAIFLSNIRGYIKPEEYAKFTNLISNDLSQHLVEGGLIAYGDSRIFELFGPKVNGVYTYKKRNY